ncbi:cyclic nucleotide-binding-like protein [Thelephora terrestris]|uniref:cAMP-dependent protein kinase regulatory subunit n=1 Tax=Thelephora terrestris TaxID=56493 RepID=A0A9P6L509_9AGAM|nr:cyclic nucleotide-binding-like protein [Thelephora terrestris]
MASTFETLIAELTRDANRVQPQDALQWCSNWFQQRLEEQRTRSRNEISRLLNYRTSLPNDHFVDTPIQPNRQLLEDSTAEAVSPYSRAPPRHRQSLANIRGPSPFGTLNVPGNALLEENAEDLLAPPPPTFNLEPNSPVDSMLNSGLYSTYQNTNQSPAPSQFSPSGPGDYLLPPSSTIFARRTSVSAESIAVDSETTEPLPVFSKTPDQLRRIRSSIANNFIFRDLDEEQETGVLNAMQEMKVEADEIVIRQGDVGEYFYVVESGHLNCYIRPEPLPPSWLSGKLSPTSLPTEEKFLQPDYHPEFGKKVAECKQGSSFGELALMYGHPRAATVLSVEQSTLWSLDRITFRTIILKAAHRRRTMYEQFLSSVTLLSSLSSEEKSKIADALVSRVLADGEDVVKQGEMGDTFFFVEEGEAIVTQTQSAEDSQLREITVGHLAKGDYFGELSLLRLAPRAATVSAVVRTDPSKPKLKVAALDAQAFTRLLGPLREIMERKAGEAYGPRYSTSRR